MDALVRMVEKIDIEQGKKLGERPKMTWMEVVKKGYETTRIGRENVG